jgi:hypothetical protein
VNWGRHGGGAILLTAILLAFPTGCGDGRKADAKPSREAQPQPQPPQKEVQLKAPKAAAELWRSWNGKYMLYAHRSAAIRSFGDLAGKMITCAYINTPTEEWVCDNILGDMQKLQLAGQISVNVGIQNNSEVYGKNLLEDSTTIGFMSAGVAEHYKFKDETNLVQLVISE